MKLEKSTSSSPTINMTTPRYCCRVEKNTGIHWSKVDHPHVLYVCYLLTSGLNVSFVMSRAAMPVTNTWGREEDDDNGIYLVGI